MRYAMSAVGVAILASGTAQAQTETRPDPDNEIIVTGTRASGRAALESSAPVDVVSGDTIADTGFPDLGRALNFLQPSVNFARAATTATALTGRATPSAISPRAPRRASRCSSASSPA